MSISNLLISVFLGFFGAGLLLMFNATLLFFDLLRNKFDWIVFGLPIAVGLSYFLKKKTLYYPKKIVDLEESQEDILSVWNRKMSLYHYLGALVSHLFGASVGREGVIVLVTSGLVPLFNLNVQFWIPIAAATGFAIVTGYQWIGLIFLIEVFNTNINQKILTFIASWTGVLLLQSYHVDPLLQLKNFDDQTSFFSKLFFVVGVGIIFGVISKIYKQVYFYLSHKLQNRLGVSILISLVLAIVLWKEEFSPLQSLSLEILEHFRTSNEFVHMDVVLILLKLILTVVCVSLGLFGGEFVPLLVIGAGLGAVLAQWLGFPHWLGLSLGAYLLLAGVTRLKWTFLLLSLILSGWNQVILFYIAYTVCLALSNHTSLYMSGKNRKSFFSGTHFFTTKV